jgi:hypothetical protein
LLKVFYLRSELPTKVLEKVSKIPGIATAKFKKDVS